MLATFIYTAFFDLTFIQTDMVARADKLFSFV
jgi:hypothetical protein